mgnify:CR=1 FL=1
MISLFQKENYQTKLTPEKLNQEMKRFVRQKTGKKNKYNQVWDKKVFVDLSKIEFVNTSALVELILIIENLIEDNIIVTVALPNRNMLSSEERHLKNHPEDKEYIDAAIEKRKNVRVWLYRLKIIRALLFEHQPENIRDRIKVLDCFDKELYDQNPVDKKSNYYKIHGPKDAEQKEIGEKYHVPLLWTNSYEYHSDSIIKNLQECIDISHAQVICDIVICESARNVEDHSKKAASEQRKPRSARQRAMV